MTAGFYGASDLDGMLVEFGVSVEHGAVTAAGILDVADEDGIAEPTGTLVAKQRMLLLKTGALPELKAGEKVKVAGVTYRVTAVRQLDDGALTRAYLGPA